MNYMFLVCDNFFCFVKVICCLIFLVFCVSFTFFSTSNFLLLFFNVFWSRFILGLLSIIYFRLSITYFSLRLVFFSLRLVFLSLCIFYCLGRFIKFILGHVNLFFSDFLFDFRFCFFLRNSLVISCRCYCRYFLCMYVRNT